MGPYKNRIELPAVTWAPGKTYTYSFTMSLNTVKFHTDINVNDWGAEEAIQAPQQPECFSNSSSEPNSVIDMIKKAQQQGKSSVYFTLPPGEEEVKPGGGTDLPSNGFSLVTANSPASVTLDGGGRVITLISGSMSSVITVNSGVTLTLKNITFVAYSSNSQPFITVNGGGTLVLDNGAVIKGNKGSMVQVSGANSKLVMKGGEISGSTAGSGVRVQSGAFEMSGGTISGNTTTNGGGVFVTGGTFTMNGGEISRNRATGNGGGVYVSGGTFIKTGGTIYGNNAEASLANKAGDDDKGHAVYVSNGAKKRNSTANPGDNLDSSTDNGWE
jgi:hypothetical protein